MLKSLGSLGAAASIGAIVLTTTAVPAKALSFDFTPGAAYLGDPDLGPGTTRSSADTFDFNSLATGDFTGASKSGVTLSATGDVKVYKGGVLPGTANNNYAPIFCGASAPCFGTAGQSTNTSGYLSIGAGGVLTAAFSKAAKYIGFAWGYADGTDTVEVNWFDSDGIITSSLFDNSLFSNQENSAYVNLSVGQGEGITSVIWSKSGNGRFEIDNISVVPTPALLPGLIGMGVAALRKRKQSGEIQEA